MRTERTTRVQWFNWTFGAWYAPRWWRRRRHTKLIAGIDLGPLQVLWTEPVQPKQLHPRVRDGRTLVTHRRHDGHPPAS